MSVFKEFEQGDDAGMPVMDGTCTPLPATIKASLLKLKFVVGVAIGEGLGNR